MSTEGGPNDTVEAREAAITRTRLSCFPGQLVLGLLDERDRLREALRKLLESADGYESEAKNRHVWDEGGALETVVRGIQQYRAALQESPDDR